MTQQRLYSIGGIDLAPCEVAIFTHMIECIDHTYMPEDSPDELERQSLDILVLEGLIERFQNADGAWMNGWIVTDGAVEWMLSPDVQADIELAKGLFAIVAS